VGVTIPPVASTEAGKPVETAAQPPGAAAFALALCVVLSCTVINLVTGGAAGHEYERRWRLVVSDFGLLGVVLTQLGAVPTLLGEWRRHRCAAAAMVLGLSLLLPLAVHPSARGVLLVGRWFGVVALAFGIGRLRGAARTVAFGAFAAATVFQVAVALAQRAADAPLGLHFLGEPRGVYLIGGRFASTGVTFHPYILAAWCTLAAAVLLAAVARSESPSRVLLEVAVLPFVAVGLTMSRAGALAVVFLLGSAAVAAIRQPRLRIVLVAAAAAAALGVLADYSGWASRAGESVGPNATNVTSGRTELLHQANGLFRLHPIVGVGPGRYVDELVQHPDLVELATQTPSRPVHVVPYLVLIEGGLVVVPALLLLAWAVITQSRRGGAVAVGVTLAVLPFLALDHLHWSFPQGLVLTGIWLGVLDLLGQEAPPDLIQMPLSSSS